ncbi:hypothetical protein K438DRAFT_1753391 [Mycena galopus ATCC 62051]|nr:hypothetical protein K438DRAFT_1753391 [Mycena galopus ATCC 62051]
MIHPSIPTARPPNDPSESRTRLRPTPPLEFTITLPPNTCTSTDSEARRPILARFSRIRGLPIHPSSSTESSTCQCSVPSTFRAWGTPSVSPCRPSEFPAVIRYYNDPPAIRSMSGVTQGFNMGGSSKIGVVERRRERDITVYRVCRAGLYAQEDKIETRTDVLGFLAQGYFDFQSVYLNSTSSGVEGVECRRYSELEAGLQEPTKGKVSQRRRGEVWVDARTVFEDKRADWAVRKITLV